MAKGRFVIEGDPHDFNLKPKDVPDPIPDDQEKISTEVYKIRNILMYLKDKGQFEENDSSLKEFMTRLGQAATVGCVDDNPNTDKAEKALAQIKKDIVRRRGKAIMFRYLLVLAGYALAGVILGAVVAVVGRSVPAMEGYGYVIIGSMVGAWISLAAIRQRLSFEGMEDFLELGKEPIIRLLFVGLLALALALFLQLKILALSIGPVNFSTFSKEISVALVLGLITGISEKAVSVKIIGASRESLAAGS